MAEKMTLEQVRDELMTQREIEGDRPITKFYERIIDAIDAHLAQPAQVVDVGAIREVIHAMGCTGSAGSDEYSADHLLDCINDYSASLTRAIGNAQAEGWRELEAEARRLYNASVGDANNLHCLAWSELSKDQQRKWISKASTAPSTQATPNAHE